MQVLYTSNTTDNKKHPRSHLNLLAVLLALLCFAGQELRADEWYDTTLRDDHVTEKLLQFFVVTDCELKMSRDDTLLLVVARCVARKLENLGRQVLENGSEVDWRTSTHSLSIVALLQETVNTANRELKAGLRRARLRLGSGLA